MFPLSKWETRIRNVIDYIKFSDKVECVKIKCISLTIMLSITCSGKAIADSKKKGLF